MNANCDHALSLLWLISRSRLSLALERSLKSIHSALDSGNNARVVVNQIGVSSMRHSAASSQHTHVHKTAIDKAAVRKFLAEYKLCEKSPIEPSTLVILTNHPANIAPHNVRLHWDAELEP